MRQLALVMLVLGLALTSCNGGETLTTVRGVVVAIDGELDQVTGFELVDQGGRRFRFSIDSDARFDGLPLSHLNEHRLSGDPVFVEYEDRGQLIAISIGDG